MANYSLIIKNGLLITGNEKNYKDVAVENGIIAAINERGAFDGQEGGAEIYDAAGKYVLPGLIEPHMHIKAPLGGVIDILDFDDASKCAAYGGVTTFMDFSSTLPGMPLLNAIENRKKEMEKSTLDYSVHCKVVNLADAEDIADAALKESKYLKKRIHNAETKEKGNDLTVADIKNEEELKLAAEAAREKVDAAVIERLREIPTIIKTYGIPTFKLFMTYRKANVMIDDVYMLKVMAAVKAAGGRCGFHAENNAIAEYNEELYQQENKLDWKYFPEYKGNICEAEAVRRVLYYAEQLNAPVYFFHLSTKESIQLVKDAIDKGLDVIAETCCHYLTFDKSKNDDKDSGILFLMSPPLRSKEDQDALWNALKGKNGTLSLVSSDNCSFTREQKEAPLFVTAENGEKIRTGNNFLKPISGVSGIEERFGIMMKAVDDGRIDIHDFVRLLSENPAKVFGCYPQKGCLEVGSDADFVIVDPHKPGNLNRQSLHYPAALDYALYEGIEYSASVVSTIRRGEFLVRDGEYTATTKGNFIKRKL